MINRFKVNGTQKFNVNIRFYYKFVELKYFRKISLFGRNLNNLYYKDNINYLTI